MFSVRCQLVNMLCGARVRARLRVEDARGAWPAEDNGNDVPREAPEGQQLPDKSNGSLQRAIEAMYEEQRLVRLPARVSKAP
jgi:hypothetical protein